MLDLVAYSDFGTELRRRRKLRGWSLRRLASRVYVSHVHITDIEHGRKRPSPWLAQLLDDVLCAGGELVELAERAKPARNVASLCAGTDERLVTLRDYLERAMLMWRSDFHGPDLATIPAVTGVQAVSPVWEWEKGPEDTDVASQGSRQVGVSDITTLQAAREHFERMYRLVGGIVVRRRVVAFVNQYTAPLLRGRYSDKTGRALFRAAGGLVALAGICAYDADAQGLAQRYFFHALRLAKASGNKQFGGYVLALLANQAFIVSEYRQAVAHADAGLRACGQYLSPALRADLNLTRAKAYARMGIDTACHQSMTAAEQAAAGIRPDNEPAEAGYVQPGLVELQLAEALTQLNDLKPARNYAEQALRCPSHPRGHVQRILTLAKVDLRQGEVEQASASVMKALDAAAGMESHQLNQRFVGLRDQLDVTHAATAQLAVERINARLAIPV